MRLRLVLFLSIMGWLAAVFLQGCGPSRTTILPNSTRTPTASIQSSEPTQKVILREKDVPIPIDITPTPTETISPVTPTATATISRIVFAGGRKVEDSHIFLIDENGDNLVQLTDGPEWDEYPTWSHNGSKISFIRVVPGESVDIYIMNPDGTHISRVPLPEELVPLYFSWAPDHKRIAISSIVKEQSETAIFIIDLETSLYEKITSSNSRNFHPAWSPDGQKIAFASNQGETSLGQGLLDIYIYDLSRKETYPVTEDIYSDLEPAWSADGKSLAYTCGNLTVICILDLDNLESRPIMDPEINEFGSHASWSPNGDKIVFTSNREIGDGLFIVSVDGTGSRRITSTSIYAVAPNWGP